ncbi:hypothetical protein ACJRO7_011261 [Eucalyptus globulus]|uniref:Uncharacterized protein n=1 Tax=Eucalyptus globulus TaxID=34317 RepID=A0ABD3LPG0_EUCGL
MYSHGRQRTSPNPPNTTKIRPRSSSPLSSSLRSSLSGSFSSTFASIPSTPTLQYLPRSTSLFTTPPRAAHAPPSTSKPHPPPKVQFQPPPPLPPLNIYTDMCPRVPNHQFIAEMIFHARLENHPSRVHDPTRASLFHAGLHVSSMFRDALAGHVQSLPTWRRPGPLPGPNGMGAELSRE